MVKYSVQMDTVFHSLSDPIRRDILGRVANCELSISELVGQYNVSFVAISKHLKVLEKARLIHKRKEGRKYMVALNADALKEADEYLDRYRTMWESRYDKLDKLLKTN